MKNKYISAIGIGIPLLLIFLAACSQNPSPAPETAVESRTTRPTETQVRPTTTPRPTREHATVEPTRTPRGGEGTPRPARDNRARTPESETEVPRHEIVNTVEPAVLEDLVPLTELGDMTYLGFEGGLYPGGSNAMPVEHSLEGMRRAAAIRPLDVNGNPDPNGKYVLLTVGMSNTYLESCGFGQTQGFTCRPWTFIGKANQDPRVNHDDLVLVNGARGAQVSRRWDEVGEDNYVRINERILPELGLSEEQVQIVWLKLANLTPKVPLPSDNAEAYVFTRQMGEIIRVLKETYPNLQQVFISSRIYAGFAKNELNPEPYAYEYGFAVKWLIEDQIEQMGSDSAVVSPISGDLNYDTVAPWLAWGPYMWAGEEPRADGLYWEEGDYSEADGIHPSEAGQAKVADLLLEFFSTSPYTECWFLAGRTCESPE